MPGTTLEYQPSRTEIESPYANQLITHNIRAITWSLLDWRPRKFECSYSVHPQFEPNSCYIAVCKFFAKKIDLLRRNTTYKGFPDCSSARLQSSPCSASHIWIQRFSQCKWIVCGRFLPAKCISSWEADEKGNGKSSSVMAPTLQGCAIWSKQAKFSALDATSRIWKIFSGGSSALSNFPRHPFTSPWCTRDNMYRDSPGR